MISISELKRKLRKKAPDSGSLTKDLTQIMLDLGVWVDWLHPRSYSEGLRDEVVYTLSYDFVVFGGVPIDTLYLVVKKNTKTSLWESKVVGQL